MERNSQSSKGLEWENLSVYGEKPIEIHEKAGYFMRSSSSDVGLYGNEFGSCLISTNTVCSSLESATTDDYGKFSSLPLYRSTNEDITRIQDIGGTNSYSEASVFSSESMNIGLNLGRHREYENFSSIRTKTSVSSLPISSSTATTTTKRSRAFYQNVRNPCCQVEGCNLDLTSVKDYHRRHRICESHSKSPMVIVAGLERRFCQQCSRFHELSEFDDKKRSCRRRLSDHNARRRRMPSEPIHLSSAALYDGRPHNVLFNAFPIPVLNQTWENPSTSILRQDRDSFIRTSNGDGTVCLSGLHLDSQIQSSNIPHNLDQYILHTPTTNSSGISQDVPSAHSLLSSNINPWSINDAVVSNSMECVVNANYNPEISDLEPNNWTVFPSNNNVSTEHVISPVHNAGTTQVQEFQLFNNPHHSPCFYSNKRNF